MVRDISKVYKGSRFNHFGLSGDTMQVNVTVSKFIPDDKKRSITDIFKENGMKKIKEIYQPGSGSGIIIQGVDK